MIVRFNVQGFVFLKVPQSSAHAWRVNFSRISVQGDELRAGLNGGEDVSRGRRGLRVFRRDEVHLGHQRPQTTAGK